MSILHVDSIEKWFGTRQILKDIFISCNTGEIVGLLGRNGSGKSTLLEIIFGTVRAENKFVRVDNIVLKTSFENKNLIHYLPQTSFLPNHIKIKKLIKIFCNKENSKAVSENNHIKPFLNNKVTSLSGGEKRMIELMLILYSDCKFLILDEPFNALSPKNKDFIKEIIRLQSQQKGIIITDHDYQNVLDIATKRILLKDGSTITFENENDLKRLGYLY